MKFLTTIITALLFTILISAKFKSAAILSLLLLFFVFFLLLTRYIEEKKFIIIFIFIYPLLPFLFGVDLGGGFPVMRAHRILVIGLIIYLVIKGKLVSYYLDFFKVSVFSLPILFVFFSILITGLLTDSTRSTLFFDFLFIIEMIILSVVVFNTFKDENEIEHLISILCYSAIILSLFGIFEKITEFNIFTTLGAFNSNLNSALTLATRDGEVRIQGPFDHSISFGAYLTMITPLVLYKFREKMLLKYFLIGLMLMAILATKSRSSLVGLLLIFIFYFFFIEKKSIIILCMCLIPFVLFDPIKFFDFVSRLNPFTTSHAELAVSTAARSEQFDFLINFIKNNLIIGHGVTETPGRMLQPDVLDSSIDNFYLLYTFYFGLLGLTTYLLFFALVIIAPLIKLGRDIKKDKILIILISSIIAFYIINFIVGLMTFHFVFYIFVGIITRKIYNHRMNFDSGVVV